MEYRITELRQFDTNRPVYIIIIIYMYTNEQGIYSTHVSSFYFHVFIKSYLNLVAIFKPIKMKVGKQLAGSTLCILKQ